MFYKIISNEKIYQLYSNSKAFNIADHKIVKEDIVRFVSFDEETSTCIIKIENPIIFNKDDLPENFREKFTIRQKMMNEIIKEYGPSYIELNGKKRGRAVKEIMSKYNLARCSFSQISPCSTVMGFLV